MIARLLSEWRYRRFMARSKKAESNAVSTQEVGRLRRERQAIVHAALEAGR